MGLYTAPIAPADYTDVSHHALGPFASFESGQVGTMDLSGLPANWTGIVVFLANGQQATFTNLGGGTISFTQPAFKGIPAATSLPNLEVNGSLAYTLGNWVRSGPLTNALITSMQVGFGASWAAGGAGGTCNGFSFTGQYAVIAYLAISNVSPTSGDVGTTVTINGSGFQYSTITDVTFGGVSATSINVISDTQLTCVAPAVTGTVAVVVTLNVSGSDFYGAYNFNYTSTLSSAFSGAMNWQITTPLGVFYQTSVAQPSNFLLPFDIFVAGILYPAGTVYVWVIAIGTPTDTGYWLSIDESFAGAAFTVNNQRPKDPRGFTEIVGFATGSTGMMGGFPGPSCVWNNHFVYAEGLYTVGTTSPVIRIFDGEFDRPVTTLPNTSAGAVPKGIMSMLTANGQVYIATYDTGTSSADFVGRVFSLNIESGEIAPVGAPFPTGHIPYAIAWHAGRLWCGTHRQSSAASGKIFYFRPGIDTAWTDDYTLSSSSVAGCTSLLSYKGKLYVGTTNAAASFAKVLVRSELGAYTTSDTGTGGTAAANNAYLALVEFGGNLYASFWNPDSPLISKIRKFDNSTWATAYTGTGTTLVPYVGFPQDGTTMLAIGGGVGYNAVLLSTADGTTWADRSAFLSQGSPASTGLPVFGVVMHG